jgi:BlaI family penicillinase repressor
MPRPKPNQLSRRERQIMDALYAAEAATAVELSAKLTDDPGYDSVRVTLRNLEKKGFVTHTKDGPRNVYRPTIPHDEATETALTHVVRTFFRGSPSRAILALMDLSDGALTDDQLQTLEARIEEARREGEDD